MLVYVCFVGFDTRHHCRRPAKSGLCFLLVLLPSWSVWRWTKFNYSLRNAFGIHFKVQHKPRNGEQELAETHSGGWSCSVIRRERGTKLLWRMLSRPASVCSDIFTKREDKKTTHICSTNISNNVFSSFFRLLQKFRLLLPEHICSDVSVYRILLFNEVNF